MATANFDKVAAGEPGYATNLVDIKGKSFDDAVSTLEEHISKVVIPGIEGRSKRKIEEFVIGKTIARRKGKNFNRTDSSTWREGGLKEKWGEFDDRDFDGLIAITATTRSVVNKKVRVDHKGFGCWAQQYALALAQQLVQKFLFVSNDKRIANTSFETVGEAPHAHAGLVYFAYKLEGGEEE